MIAPRPPTITRWSSPLRWCTTADRSLSWSGAARLEGDVFGGLRFGVGDCLWAGGDFEAEVAAAVGPFVVLFGQHGADEADDGDSLGEDSDDVGLAPNLLIEALFGVVALDLSPDLLGERGEGKDVRAGVLEVVRDRGQFAGEGIDDAVELGAHRWCVALVVGRVLQRLDPRP